MTFIDEYKSRFPAKVPNTPIDIALNQSYTCELKDGRQIQGKVDIQLRLLPRVKIQLTENQTNLRGIDYYSNDSFSLFIHELGSNFDVIISSLTERANCVFQLVNSDFLIHMDGPVIEVCCSLINFRPIEFPITMTWGKWIVKVLPVTGLRQTKNELHTYGGYAVTHLVSITNESLATFTLEDFQPIWDGLYHLFSFANGGWSTPVLPVGYNTYGEVVFQQFQPRITSLWCDSTRNWFNEMKPGVLENLFPGFMSLFTDSIWAKELRTVIYWYVNSERSLPSLDTTIILAQAPLELLSWQYLVIISGKLSEAEFKDRRFTTAHKIRRLLEENNIPVEIPVECDELTYLYPKGDGPYTITDNRNDIVHPVTKKQHSIDEMNQVWDLSMYYIERVILNLAGYQGLIDQRFRPSNLRGASNSL